jgi:hypothetical protein
MKILTRWLIQVVLSVVAVTLFSIALPMGCDDKKASPDAAADAADDVSGDIGTEASDDVGSEAND